MQQTIEVSWEKFWPISNVLNEVCHGININNFHEEIGFEYEEIYLLLKKIKEFKNLDEKEQVKQELSSREIEIIKKSFKEVVRQIDEWEFPIRIGMTIPEVTKIIDEKTFSI